MSASRARSATTTWLGRRLRLLSLRWLIAGLYLAAIIPMLAGLGVVIDLEHRAAMIDNRARELATLVDNILDPLDADDRAAITDPSDREERNARAAAIVRHLGEHGFDAAVVGAIGEPLSASTDGGPWLAGADLHAADGQRATTVATPIGERIVYAASVPDMAGEGQIFVEASLPMTVVDQDVATLRTWLVLAIGGAALVALLLAPAVGALAVRPIGRLVETARAVARGDLDRRAEPMSSAELQELSSAFNLMLDRMGDALRTEAASAQLMRRFAADASHEFRSPLAVLASAADVLERALHAGDADQARDVLPLLRNEVHALARLVDDLLLLAKLDRVEPDRPRLTTSELEEIDPVPLLEEAAERARAVADGTAIRLDWPRQPVAPIYGDPVAIGRAIDNVVENALFHTPAGGEVRLSMRATPHACRFVVVDEGSGIAPDQLPHIFERFYRGEVTRSRRPGNGLGLAVVQAIIEAHGGQVKLTSEVGAGTTVVIELPRDRPQLQQRTSP